MKADIYGENTDRVVEMVTEFITTFKQEPSVNLYQELLFEEAKELALEGMKVSVTDLETMIPFMKEVADVIYVGAGMIACNQLNPDQEVEIDDRFLNVVNHVQDILGVLEVALTEDLMMEAIEVVHKSNMSKVDDEGNPIFKENGKIAKGPNYVAPDMTPVAEKVVANFKDLMDAAAESLAA